MKERSSQEEVTQRKTQNAKRWVHGRTTSIGNCSKTCTLGYALRWPSCSEALAPPGTPR